MNFKKLVESKKTITGISGTFKTMEKDDNSKVMIFQANNGKKYILKTSLSNFVRFQKWNNKEATIDFREVGSIIINKIRYSTILIRANVKVEE